jgi:hypothetical protein
MQDPAGSAGFDERDLSTIRYGIRWTDCFVVTLVCCELYYLCSTKSYNSKVIAIAEASQSGSAASATSAGAPEQ